MREIQTGKGTIPLISLLAIWSISLVVDLPGLAISPLLSNLDTIFPNTPELEIQLLTILPNFFILPFILLSGKLSISKSKVLMVVVGLLIFLACGIAYFFAQSMIMLIAISCLLGIGCGLIIPLAAGLLAEYFTGHYRMKQLGIKSGIANFSLIIATLIVGWIGTKDWHLPFIVYMLPIIPLLLSPFLTKKHLHIQPDAISSNAAAISPNKCNDSENTVSHKCSVTNRAMIANEDAVTNEAPHIQTHLTAPLSRTQIKMRLWAIIGFYFLITSCAIVLAFFIPFLMQKEKMSDTETGIINSVFYLFITLPGFFLGQVVKHLKNQTTIICIICMSTGLYLIALVSSFWSYLLAAALIGFGYGTLQPIFYDKTATITPNADQSTLYLSFVMAANYIGIATTPFLLDFFGMIFQTHSDIFPFIFNGSVMVFTGLIVLLFRNTFVFKTDSTISS